MKGSSFYGYGNSPAKVSDEAVVAAQSKLDSTELDFREPGWAKVAGKVHGDTKKAIGAVLKGAAGAI